MIKKGLLLVLGVVVLVGCGTALPGVPAESVALMATAQAVSVYETRQAAQATAAAVSVTQTAIAQATGTVAAQNTAVAQTLATSTAVHQATADSLAFMATQVSIQATATSVSMANSVEQLQLRNHEVYLMNQRRREEMWLVITPWLIAIGVLIAAAVVITFLWRYLRVSMPVVNSAGEVLLAPVGVYEQPRITASQRQPLALPAPTMTVSQPPKLLPEMREGHVMVIGPSWSGKSTAFRALIKPRSNVTVIDPHYAPGDWPEAHVIGGGGNFEAIAEFMEWMDEELRTRRQQRYEGQRVFRPVTVATDEMPLIAGELGGDAWTVWRRWLREGWKFGLFFMMSTQSDRVKTLGIEGEKDVLQNAGAILYLGETAKEKYPALVSGLKRPAIMVQRGGTPQPVIIPYVAEEDPNSPLFRGGQAIALPQPGANGHGPEVLGIDTDQGFISPAQVLKVRQMTLEGKSGREIEREVFGYEGGQAFYLRKRTQEALQLAVDV